MSCCCSTGRLLPTSSGTLAAPACSSSSCLPGQRQSSNMDGSGRGSTAAACQQRWQSATATAAAAALATCSGAPPAVQMRRQMRLNAHPRCLSRDNPRQSLQPVSGAISLLVSVVPPSRMWLTHGSNCQGHRSSTAGGGPRCRTLVSLDQNIPHYADQRSFV